MKIILSGCNGRMGQAITKKLPKDCQIVCGVTKNPKKILMDYPVYKELDMIRETGDVIIDFTVSENIVQVLNYAISKKIPLVIGTTGIDEAQKSEILKASKYIPILYSGNTSFGVALMLKLVKEAAKSLESEYDIEIIEKHDKNKLDSPSGTSKMIVNGINDVTGKKYKVVNGRNEDSPIRKKDEIGLHSFRGGNLSSEHYVSFVGEDETLEINHKARNFDIFAVGAIKASKLILNKASNLYSMDDIFEL